MAQALEAPRKLLPSCPAGAHALVSVHIHVCPANLEQSPAGPNHEAQAEAQQQQALQHDTISAQRSVAPEQAAASLPILAPVHVGHGPIPVGSMQQAAGALSYCEQAAVFIERGQVSIEVSKPPDGDSCSLPGPVENRQQALGEQCDEVTRSAGPEPCSSSCASGSGAALIGSSSEDGSGTAHAETEECKGDRHMRPSRHSLSTAQACAAFLADASGLHAWHADSGERDGAGGGFRIHLSSSGNESWHAQQL